MLDHVPLMGAVKMSFMQIIDVALVFDCGMAAVWTMRMGVLVMRFVVAHFSCLLPVGGFSKQRESDELQISSSIAGERELKMPA